MKAKLLIALGIALIVAGGCQQATTTTGGTSGTVSSSASAGAATAGGTSGGGTQAQPAAVPEELKTDAYRWYGLGNDKTINFEVSATSMSYKGSQTMHLQSVENGKAIFQVERTGEFGDQLGNDTITLDKDGVYVTKSTKFTSESSNLDLPSKLDTGTTWKNDGKLDMTSGQHFEQHLTLKVVGPQKVTTKVGTQDSLLVSSAGNVKIDSTDYRMESRLWYVKDKGLVKSVVTMKSLADKKAKPQVITIEETK